MKMRLGDGWPRRISSISILISIVLLAFGCSKDDSVAPGDTVPPAHVRNLVAIEPTPSTITLTWTAPGDNGTTGTAAQYDIRYSKNPLTDAVWPSASKVTDPPRPRPAGSADTCVVTGLEPSTAYYFALKSADEAGNWSTKSNIASAATTARQDVTPPAAVTDLAATDSTTVSVTLAWTAPGNDGNTGTAARYDIRYSTSPLTDAAWAYAMQTAGEPPPKAAGAAESFVVTGLAPGTRYYFALKTADEKPNWSALSTVASATTKTP
ncbi:MAG: fibronectin type III domain-containing protein [Candidatus Krumholzibacteriaceae bacterium]|jgi:chitodextrinase